MLSGHAESTDFISERQKLNTFAGETVPWMTALTKMSLSQLDEKRRKTGLLCLLLVCGTDASFLCFFGRGHLNVRYVKNSTNQQSFILGLAAWCFFSQVLKGFILKVAKNGLSDFKGLSHEIFRPFLWPVWMHLRNV
jgi:hypothetical protein